MSMTWNSFSRVALAFLWIVAVLPAEAQSPVAKDADQPLVVIVHVDIIPPSTDAAVVLLKNYRQDSLKEAGVKRVEVLQQVGRPNHFTLVEEWENQAAYDHHVSAPATIQFRTRIAPMLGSPFDERLHRSIE